MYPHGYTFLSSSTCDSRHVKWNLFDMELKFFTSGGPVTRRPDSGRQGPVVTTLLSYRVYSQTRREGVPGFLLLVSNPLSWLTPSPMRSLSLFWQFRLFSTQTTSDDSGRSFRLGHTWCRPRVSPSFLGGSSHGHRVFDLLDVSTPVRSSVTRSLTSGSPEEWSFTCTPPRFSLYGTLISSRKDKNLHMSVIK